MPLASAYAPTPALRVIALLLAAGLSQRMGARNKLLADVGGEPLVRRVAKAYLAAGIDVRVVLGFEATRVRAALGGLPLVFVENARYGEGQATSVRAGLAGIDAGCDAVMVALGDQAALTTADIAGLLGAFADNARAPILIPYYRGQRGNPVVFSAETVSQINALPPDAAARDYIEANPHCVRRYEAPNDHFVIDIDTPGDLTAFERHLGAAKPDQETS